MVSASIGANWTPLSASLRTPLQSAGSAVAARRLPRCAPLGLLLAQGRATKPEALQSPEEPATD
eukprot:CAMPEP_0180801218 /NCGR_PEP_ID=MMETSP1038_2-20121128/59532_1 /TAXON_ID=632150 /ORGANISM="Azadinium spinosum, Strain 3D9" /LENGTH=63 /DNA_ID=CAMNT_0022841023 /DNA_START=334 /DNA_END=522 /DNA_ORIENTATION=-